MNKTYIAFVLIGIVVVVGLVILLGHAEPKAGGSTDTTKLSSCTYTLVNVSTTRQRALAGTGARQWARFENGSSTAGVASDVFYIFSNASTTASTSTSRRLQAGEVEFIKTGENLWNGDVWLLNNNPTAVPVLIAECY